MQTKIERPSFPFRTTKIKSDKRRRRKRASFTSDSVPETHAADLERSSPGQGPAATHMTSDVTLGVTPDVTPDTPDSCYRSADEESLSLDGELLTADLSRDRGKGAGSRTENEAGKEIGKGISGDRTKLGAGGHSSGARGVAGYGIRSDCDITNSSSAQRSDVGTPRSNVPREGGASGRRGEVCAKGASVDVCGVNGGDSGGNGATSGVTSGVGRGATGCSGATDKEGTGNERLNHRVVPSTDSPGNNVPDDVGKIAPDDVGNTPDEIDAEDTEDDFHTSISIYDDPLVLTKARASPAGNTGGTTDPAGKNSNLVREVLEDRNFHTDPREWETNSAIQTQTGIIEQNSANLSNTKSESNTNGESNTNCDELGTTPNNNQTLAYQGSKNSPPTRAAPNTCDHINNNQQNVTQGGVGTAQDGGSDVITENCAVGNSPDTVADSACADLAAQDDAAQENSSVAKERGDSVVSGGVGSSPDTAANAHVGAPGEKQGQAQARGVMRCAPEDAAARWVRYAWRQWVGPRARTGDGAHDAPSVKQD